MPDAKDPVDTAIEQSERNLESEVVDLEDGTQVRIAQQNVGPGVEIGGGEFPEKATGPATGVRGNPTADEDGVVDPVDGFEHANDKRS